MIVLLIFAGLMGVLFAYLLLEQLLFERRKPAPIRWPGHATPPPLPPPTPWHTDLNRARPALDGTGRHRRLGGHQ